MGAGGHRLGLCGDLDALSRVDLWTVDILGWEYQALKQSLLRVMVYWVVAENSNFILKLSASQLHSLYLTPIPSEETKALIPHRLAIRFDV